MPINYNIDVRTGVVHTTASGVLTEKELFEFKSRLEWDPRFRPGMRELSDVRAVTELAMSPEAIALFVQQDKLSGSSLDNHRLAIVVSDEVTYTMARMYEFKTATSIDPTSLERKGVQVRIFRHMDLARAWLGLDEGEENARGGDPADALDDAERRGSCSLLGARTCEEGKSEK